MRHLGLLLCLVLVVVCSVLLSTLSSLLNIQETRQQLNTSADSSFMSNSPANLTWVLQLSDLHISQYYDPGRVDDLLELTQTTLEIVRPAAVIVTGDLTDARSNDSAGSGQNRREWDLYRLVVDEGLKRSVWLDIPGNHDRFDVHAGSDQDMYGKYRRETEARQRVQRLQQGRQSLIMLEHNNVKLAFIGVDATPFHGPRRPFNFLGQLKDSDLEDLKVLSTRAGDWTQSTIWFGHYPTSSIVSSAPGLREVGANGLVYVAGHLHSMYGTTRNMFARHPSGLMEAELEDWKDGRMWRLLAIDHGRLAFTDVRHGTWPVILVTWPPRMGRGARPVSSTHIRILVFSAKPIHQVLVSIDGGLEQRECVQDLQTRHLYRAEWDLTQYTHIHTLTVKAVHKDGTSLVEEYPFSLVGAGYSQLPLHSRLVLLVDLSSVFAGLFLVSVLVCVCPLLYCRSTLSTAGGMLEGMYLLASVDRLYLPLVLYPLYMLAGPWCGAQVLTGTYGILFSWGILVFGQQTGFLYMPAYTTFLYGAVHHFFTHFPLIVILSVLVRERCRALQQNLLRRFTPLGFVVHAVLLVLLGHQAYMVHSFYLAYGLLTLLGPMRLGELVLSLVLLARVWRLKPCDFSKFRGLRSIQTQKIQ